MIKWGIHFHLHLYNFYVSIMYLLSNVYLAYLSTYQSNIYFLNRISYSGNKINNL